MLDGLNVYYLPTSTCLSSRGQRVCRNAITSYLATQTMVPRPAMLVCLLWALCGCGLYCLPCRSLPFHLSESSSSPTGCSHVALKFLPWTHRLVSGQATCKSTRLATHDRTLENIAVRVSRRLRLGYHSQIVYLPCSSSRDPEDSRRRWYSRPHEFLSFQPPA